MNNDLKNTPLCELNDFEIFKSKNPEIIDLLCQSSLAIYTNHDVYIVVSSMNDTPWIIGDLEECEEYIINYLENLEEN